MLGICRVGSKKLLVKRPRPWPCALGPQPALLGPSTPSIPCGGPHPPALARAEQEQAESSPVCAHPFLRPSFPIAMSHLPPTRPLARREKRLLRPFRLLRTIGPGCGMEPKGALAFPGMLILPLRLVLCAMPEGWVESHGQGTFSEHMDPFSP